MGIRCHCPDCNARFEIRATHAGRRVKCPKCGGAIEVPETTGGAAPPPIAARHATPPPVAEQGAPPIAATLDAPPLIDDHSHVPETTDTLKPLASNRSTNLALKLTGAALLIGFVALGLYVYLVDNVPPVAVDSSSNPGKTSVNPSSTLLASIETDDATETYLKLNWPEEERTGGAIFIDNREYEVPSTGEVKYQLIPGSYQLHIVRRGYDQLDLNFTLKAGGSFGYTPTWHLIDIPTGVATAGAVLEHPFDGWLQDFEAAKRKATSDDKSILILFNGSDWSSSCQSLAAEVLCTEDFRDRASKDFVLVHIDLPQYAATTDVEDIDRNYDLQRYFEVELFPTVLITDCTGRILCVDQGYEEGEYESFVSKLEHWARIARNSPKGASVAETGINDEPPLPARDQFDSPQEFLAAVGLTHQDGFFMLPAENEVIQAIEKVEAMHKETSAAKDRVEQAQKKVDRTEREIQQNLEEMIALKERAGRRMTRELLSQISAKEDRATALQRVCNADYAAVKAADSELSIATEDYIELLIAAQKLHQKTLATYERLMFDESVAEAIRGCSSVTATEHKPGPTPDFITAGEKLQELEGTYMSDKIALRRGNDQLWYVPVVFNDTEALEMIVDTGATSVSLPWNVAVQLGLDPANNGTTSYVSVADGGVIPVKKIRVPKVRVGKFVARNVLCAVLPPQAVGAPLLLGHSFFRHFNCHVDTARGKLVLAELRH